MKTLKWLVVAFAVMVGPMRPAFAETNPFLNQIEVGLLSHVEVITEFTTRGKTNVELLATPFRIGRVAGDYIVGIDAGVLGVTNPIPGEKIVNGTIGVHFHLTPIFKRYIFTAISPDYRALQALEINPRASILFTDGHKIPTYGLSVGYAFSLEPLL